MRTVMKRLAPAAASIACVVTASNSNAAPTLRYQTDQVGDFALFGQTIGVDCGNNGSSHVQTGTVTCPNCGILGGVDGCNATQSDTGPDEFWRSASPQAGEAQANNTIAASDARSASLLQLPAGAAVTYARLYWGANVNTSSPGTSAQVTSPTGTTVTVAADDGVVYTYATNNYWYQSTADVTSIVQANGAGVYTVGNVASIALDNLNSNSVFVGWSIVVFYTVPTGPRRNLAIFDGLDHVANGAPSSGTITGFTVPNAGFDAKLGVVAYEGDSTITGDQLLFNGNALTNLPGSTNNFFNSGRSFEGTAVSNTGDLPKLDGQMGALASFDMHVVDVTSYVNPGDTSATFSATSTGDDYGFGVFVTSISTLKPDFTASYKTVADITHPGAASISPGDILEYTIDTTNNGTDASSNTIITDPIPAQVTYLPGSLQISAGANQGPKTDAVGDDQAEFSAGTVTFRVGTGANATNGGSLAIGASTEVKFRVTVNAGVNGKIDNQASISAGGALGAPPTTTPTDGNGTAAGTPPTEVTVGSCNSDADCPTGDHCRKDVNPPICVQCLTSADCSGGTPVCNTTTNTCAGCVSDQQCAAESPATPACQLSGTLAGDCTQCSASQPELCTVASGKPVCITSLGACGCNADSDCGGLMSGDICSASTSPKECKSGCSVAPGRNGCPAGQVCSDQTGGEGICGFGTCAQDSDCPVGKKCDVTGAFSDGGPSGICVDCLSNSDCTAPEICDTDDKRCVECTPQNKSNCSGSTKGLQCLPSSETCGCDSDADCASGRVCDLALNTCTPGCDPSLSGDAGGSQCPAGTTCVATDAGAGIGACVAVSSLDGGTGGEGGVGSGSADGGIVYDNGYLEGGGCHVGNSEGGSAGFAFTGLVTAIAIFLARRKSSKNDKPN